MTFPIASLVAISLGLANFAYQGLGAQDWLTAIERTWFQTVACLTVAAADHFIRRSVGGE